MFPQNALAWDQLGFPIRIIVVPHTGHVPFDAGLPFFRVTLFGSFISRFALHFTQYASMNVWMSYE